jgi:hypothetical protein
MANIATVADFIGQNNIPDKDLISDNLTWFINKYEPVLLTKLLGSDLYSLLQASPTDARFVAIIEPYLHPAIIDYVYWFYLDDQGTQLTSMGAAQGKKQNAKSVSPYPKMVRAWNEMVKLNRELEKYISNNAAIYPEWVNPFPTWYFYCAYWGWGYGWDFSIGGFWYDNGDDGCVDEVFRYKNRIGL